jgi:phosphate transport system substrate-binding protein
MKRYHKYIPAVACAVLLTFAQWESVVRADDAHPVRVTGSQYMFFTVTDLARWYMQDQPDSKVAVTSADQYAYLQSILDKTSDVVMSLGKLEEDVRTEATENGVELAERVIGWGAVAVVTHPDNPVNELSQDQVRKIFLGEYRNWNEVGGLDEPIIVMSRDEAVSGTAKIFLDVVLQGFPTTQDTVRLFDPDIAGAIRRRRGSIADARYTEAVRGKLKGKLKIIAIKEHEESVAVMPSVDTIRDQTYPISVPLVLYYDAGSCTPELSAFVEFCARRGLGPHYANLRAATTDPGTH